MKTVVIQKAVVTNSSGQILALKRSDTDVRRPLQWDLPGGWLDENETHEKGLLREIFEETGIDAGNIVTPQLFYTETAIKTWQEGLGALQQGNCVFLFYVVVTNSTEVVLSSEHVLFEWKSPEAALQDFEYDLHVRALKHLQTVKK